MIEPGAKFGRLTVLCDGGMQRVRSGVIHWWWCRCEICGREERISNSRLAGLEACSVCRRGPCVVCGAAILAGPKRNTCSPACNRAKKRNTANLHAAKRLLANPDWHREHHARIQADPEQARKRREISRRANAAWRGKEENKPVTQARNAAYHAAHQQAAKTRRKDRLAALSSDERAELVMRRRAAVRRYEQKILADPVRHAARIERARLNRIERARQAEIERLREAAASLQDRADE